MRISGVTVPIEAQAVQALVDEVQALAQQAPLPAEMLAQVERLGPELMTVETHTRPLRVVAEPTEGLRNLVRQARAYVARAA